MKKYQIIYADPPWKYDFCVDNDDKIEKQYPTMELQNIMYMKIPSKENAVLFLWVTAPKLIEGLKVMEAWGFIYKTQAIWDKKSIGTGYWFRGQHEILLVGVKGSFSPPPNSLRVSSIIRSKRRNHSKKPDIVRSLIDKWYPDKSKLELFARNKFEGWDVWGNEAPTQVQKLLN